MQRHFGLPASKLHVIYNGVDLQRFHPRLRQQWHQSTRQRLGIADDARVYLFVGSGFERKGVPLLLQAFAQSGAGSSGISHLIIVGADRKTRAMQALARSMGLGARVHFPGPQKDVGPWYAAADCFVLPTVYDPFPNVVLEALACGLPVIVSSQCGAAELIENGVNGWVCDAQDAAGLAALMNAAGLAGLAQMRPAARALAEKYPLDGMADELVALYRNLLERKPLS